MMRKHKSMVKALRKTITLLTKRDKFSWHIPFEYYLLSPFLPEWKEIKMTGGTIFLTTKHNG
jgi:hypothetical protein